MQEVNFAEAILGWVIEKAAIQPALERRSRHLFEKECATWL
jgi:hypothetical protein